MTATNQSSLLNQINIVLVNTSHPGNIGSAARAMKTMGLSNLILAYPEHQIDEQSYALSAGAEDLLKKARVVPTLAEALEGSTLIIGASARRRTYERPLLDPHEMGGFVIEQAKAGSRIAVMFGCERTGLTNEELEICNYHVTIPANPDYSSLNLAMAVQVLSYEIRQSFLKYLGNDPMRQEIVHTSEKYLEKEQIAGGDEVLGFYSHLEDVLQTTGFLHENNRGHIMRKIKRIFTRPFLTRDDINILRGILSSVTRTIDHRNE